MRIRHPKSEGSSGLTILELMIVVSVIAILATIAIPKLGNMVRKANEAATQGKLGSLRAALSIYYADNEGEFPSDLTPMTQPGSKYLTGIIPIWHAKRSNSNVK